MKVYIYIYIYIEVASGPATIGRLKAHNGHRHANGNVEGAPAPNMEDAVARVTKVARECLSAHANVEGHHFDSTNTLTWTDSRAC